MTARERFLQEHEEYMATRDERDAWQTKHGLKCNTCGVCMSNLEAFNRDGWYYYKNENEENICPSCMRRIYVKKHGSISKKTNKSLNNESLGEEFGYSLQRASM